tara:strand:- start:152 stop:1192 length:1041 start_codon:yes stop_codon:yes gene_type:complete
MSQINVGTIKGEGGENSVTIGDAEITTSSGNISLNSGNVGIMTGTDTPATTFHVSGDNPRARFTDTPNSVNFDIFMGDDNATVGMQTNHKLAFMTNDSNVMTLFNNGYCSIGADAGTSHNGLYVKVDKSSWGMTFWNDGGSNNREGLNVNCGTDNASGTSLAYGIYDGDGHAQGFISFSGGTVTYGAFTAHHPCKIPDADNDPSSKEFAYPYGTLLETTSLFYDKRKDGSEKEKAIRYNVRKSTTANSKKVLGAYGGSFNEFDHTPDNEHLALILGDGHIICNNEGGNISMGDGICTSSAEGIGMKATVNPSMIIGIAQEDITFSNSSETKLVAVQYGLQQWTPWS